MISKEVIKARDPEMTLQVTIDKMVIALWKKVINSDDSEADLLQ